MTTFWRVLRCELRHRILSWDVPAMAAVVTLCYYMSSAEEIEFMRNAGSADVLNFFDLAENIGAFAPMSLLCCTVLNCKVFSRDLATGFYRSKIVRCSKTIYPAALFASGVICAGVILSSGMLLYLLNLSALFPLVSENSSMLESYLSMSESVFTAELLRNGNCIGFFGVHLLLAFLFGCVHSAVGLTVSAFLPDSRAASFSPYILWMALSGFLPELMRTEVIFKGNFRLGGAARSMAYAVAYQLAVVILLGVIFICKAKGSCEQ